MNPDQQAAVAIFLFAVVIILFVLWIGRHEDE